MANAKSTEAHGEQVLFILGADVAVLVGALVIAAFWRVPWIARATFLLACAGAVIATNIMPWFPNTVGGSARYQGLALVLIFGGPPVLLGSVLYVAIARWYRLRKGERGAS